MSACAVTAAAMYPTRKRWSNNPSFLDCREAGSPESIIPAPGLWIPGALAELVIGPATSGRIRWLGTRNDERAQCHSISPKLRPFASTESARWLPAAAAALGAAGAQVTLAARTKSEIDQAAAAICGRGDKAESLMLDVTDVEPARGAVAQAEPFQILINNAGMNRPAYLPDVKVEDFDAIFALNVRAAFFMAQAVTLQLIAAKLPGSIINVSSQMGHVGAARRTVYCASKHAMEGFTKAMAIELAPHNIRVNSLGPTFLETPMTRPFFENKAFRDEVLSKIKLGRLGQLEELTGAIVFLASDASSLMTGAALVLDGGWTAE